MSFDRPPDTPPVCDYEGSDYQTSFWDDADRAYEDQVESVALRRLLPQSGDLLLEVGAGAGRNTPRYTGFSRIVLLDYSRTQLQQAQKRLGRVKKYLFVAADAYRLPFVSGLFDTITMIRVLHHMADAPRAIGSIRRVLRSQGIFILEFASKHHLKAILRYWLGRQDWSPFTHDPVEFARLNFDFHPAAVREWLSSSNFKVKRQLTVSHFRVALLKKWIPLRILVALDALAQHTGNLWQLTPSVFVRSVGTGGLSADPPAGFFQCPACSQPLPVDFDPFHLAEIEESDQLLACDSCQSAWAVRDGIFDFKEPVG